MHEQDFVAESSKSPWNLRIESELCQSLAVNTQDFNRFNTPSVSIIDLEQNCLLDNVFLSI